MVVTDNTMKFARLRRLQGRASSSALPPAVPMPRALQTLACYLRPLTYLNRCRASLGNTFSIHPVDMPPLVFLCDPDDIRAVMRAPDTVLHPGAGGTAIEPIVGEHSFMLHDEYDHLLIRRAILPAFRPHAIAAHEQIISELIERTVAAWPLDAPVALHPYLRSLTLKVILRTIFTEEEIVLDKLHTTLLSMLAATASPVFQEPRLRWAPSWRGTWRQFLRLRREADELFGTLIHRRLASGKPRGDILDILLATRQLNYGADAITQVRDNVMSMILAGHETTASELAWAFQLIAHHPRVQSRLIAEIDEGEDEGYLTATVHEVLRHRPVFLFAIPRVVIKPVVIGGWRYMPPAQLLSCIYLVHHDPAVYSDPDEFRPERFLGSAPQRSIWIPWGGGHKRCPGHRLAMVELKAVLRAVLRVRSVLPAGGQLERARWRSVIITPHAGARVVMRARSRSGSMRAGSRAESLTV